VATAHRQVLDEMQTRLADLTALGAQLDDRTRTLRSRLDVAEGRFVLVTRQAGDAERIANLVAAASRTSAEFDERVEKVGQALASFEGRANDLRAVADRAHLLGQELDQRQLALDRASEHLTRASLLRQEAVDAVRQLDERTRGAQDTASALDDRTTRADAVSDELEGRVVAFRAIEDRIAHFRADFERWEKAKHELHRSLELMAGRQATVDALGDNVREMFEVAERTADDLKAAAGMHHDILQFRPAVDDLVSRLHEADEARASLDLRKHEIGQAERQLARADAVLIDIQSSLETLHNQKATLDGVIEKTGALAFQIQQGEALIDRLRKERDITNSVRIALDGTGNRPARPRAS
jgi:chromosome segregation ATPase